MTCWLTECMAPLIAKLGFGGFPVGSSLVRKGWEGEPCVYIRDESHDNINFNTSHVQLFIDCLDDPALKREYTADDVRPPKGYTPKLLTDLNYHHVTYAAATYYCRNAETEELLAASDKDKSKFCSFMFKNREWGGGILRYEFFKALTKLKEVDDVKGDARYSVRLFDEAVELHAPYRFAIAFENSVVGGYVTEKIVNAYLAGCIPIYRGHCDIYKYFNRDSFINADDFGSLDELAEYVVRVDETPSLYEKYKQAAPSTKEKLAKFFV